MLAIYGEIVWDYTPQKTAALIRLLRRRRHREMGENLVILRAAQGEHHVVKDLLRKLDY